jgi:DNA-binding response OmpR family regulator
MTRIVLVDDSPVVLESGRMMLEEAGFEVIAIDNPLSVAHVILRKRPDLVLLDINMPTLGGDVVTRIVRRTCSSVAVPIVLHSDLPASELARRVEECGASGFICKTHDAESLLAQVRAFLPPAATGSTPPPL